MRNAACLLVAMLISFVANAEGFRERFTDPEDGSFDISSYLLDHKGALPIPIVITEPAVGYGGGIALSWFSESIRDAAAKAGPSGRITPPNIYAAAYFATENGTKGGGIGGRMSFDDDRWRYRGVVGDVSLNLDFYGIGGGLGKIGYNLDGTATFQEMTRRLGDSDHYLGLRWLYMDLKASFSQPDAETQLTLPQLARKSSEIGVTYVYDSRDNIFFTRSGLEVGVDAMFSEPGIGSDTRFQAYRGHAFWYLPAGEKLVVALRADARAARGDAPFYQLPFIDMRGIPSGRYQDENTAVAEIEARYYVTPRWIALGFAGVGRPWGAKASFSNANDVSSQGVGFRYVIARRLGLAMGIDIARGPEKTAFYVQMGNAWR
jgi:Omp85 superfamily domain